MPNSSPQVGIVMGSLSDYETVKSAEEALTKFGIRYETKVVSAHRTPRDLAEYGGEAAKRGLKVIIAAAGGAAHLPGMMASYTTLPVIGVPVQTATLSGVDSLYSIVQMPKGVPVATVGIGSAENAGILAARILGAFDDVIAKRLLDYADELEFKVAEMNRILESKKE